MSEKIIGYGLLALGLAIIFVSAFSVFLVFSSRQKPIQLFNFPGITINMGSSLQASLPKELQSAINLNDPALRQEIVPASLLNESGNIIAYLILMGFVVNIGFKIASLGTQMARPIIVKLNQVNKPQI